MMMPLGAGEGMVLRRDEGTLEELGLVPKSITLVNT
jgi:hypothetical protein